MTNDSANTPSRRIDDHLPSQPLQWEDQPEAVRQERAKTARRLANELADAGAAFLAHMGTGGGIAAIPNTGPAQYVVAGTMAAIREVLGEQTSTPVPRGGGITSIEGLTRYVLCNDGEMRPVSSAARRIGGEFYYVSDVERFISAGSPVSAVEQPTGDLPPKPHTTYNGYSDGSEPLWTAEHMDDYARAAIAAHLAQQPKAEQPAASINTEDFRKLLFVYTEALFGGSEKAQGESFAALVDHIHEWRAAHLASQSQAAQPTAEQIMELAHSWAQAAYKKALNLPFEDIDAIRKKLREAATHLAGQSQATATDAQVERFWAAYNEATQFGSMIDATKKALAATGVSQQATKVQAKPIIGAYTWYHRGMVNFDEADALKALDDGKGTSIALYLAAPGDEATQDQLVGAMYALRAIASGIENPTQVAESALAVIASLAAAPQSLTAQEVTQQAAPVAAAARAAERIDAMHKGVVGVFAEIKAEHLASLTQQAAKAETGAQAIIADLAAVVRAQNGNQHADINELLCRAENFIAPTTSTVSAPELSALSQRLRAMLPSNITVHDLRAIADGIDAGTQAAPEEVRNQALSDAEDAARAVMDAADEASESAESIGAFRCINAIRALKRTSTDQADTDTGSAA